MRAFGVVAFAGVFALQGCSGDEDPTGVIGDVNLNQATGAGAQVVEISKVALSEALLDEVETPLTTAAGDLESLGDFGVGDDDLGNLGDLGSVLANTFVGLEKAGRLGASSKWVRQFVAQKATGDTDGVDACSSIPDNKCALSRICIDPTSDPDIMLVTIERSSCEEGIARSEQRFHVDNNGTPEDAGDDQIRSFWSLLEMEGGNEFELSMQPRDVEFIDDNVIVDVIEVIRPAVGLIDQQRNTITLDVGLVSQDADEVIWSLASEVSFRNGSSMVMTVTEGNENGITDDDELHVISQFRAAPANRRVESITSTIDILVHDLVDPEDDQIAGLSRETLFDGMTSTGTQPMATTTFVPVEPVSHGEEPCGGTFEKHAVFPAAWETEALDHVIEVSCSGGGLSSLEIGFSDETSLERTIAWSGSGQVTVIETGRDGTVTQGNFDRLDNTFSIDTTFPAGNDPVLAHQEGSSNRETGTRDYDIVVTFLDEHQESLHVSAQRNENGSRSLNGHSIDAAGRVDFEMAWDPETRTLSGSAAGPAQQSSNFTLTREDDGSAELVFAWADPAQDLSVAGESDINPDGSGCGEMNITQAGSTVTVPFCFEADGNGFISDTAGGEIAF